MAGYHDHSRSNNAVQAEQCFARFPATVLAKKLRVQAGAIKALMEPGERHHTSSWHNETDYYDGELLLAVSAGDEGDNEEMREAAGLLARLRTWKPPPQKARTWTGCAIEWLEWGGTRKRPTATEKKAIGCTVEWKGGAMVVITFADGSVMRKKIRCRGFRAVAIDGSLITNENTGIRA